MTRSSVGTALLIVGYPVAVVALLRLRAMFHERRALRFVVVLAGTVAVAAGYALHGRGVGLALNLAIALGLLAVWWWTGSRGPAAPPPRGRE